MGNAFKARANFIYWQSGAPTINPVFAENDWSTIIYACQHNMVPDTWVADGTCYKDMEINGTNYRIDIIGKNHDMYAEGGTAPLTFQMHDCYSERYAMNSSATNIGGWKECDMRNTHLPAILNLMPEEVQAGIRAVQKKSGQNGSPIDTTNDKLFLLSEIELYGEIFWSVRAGEGTQYDYYKSGGNPRKKKWNGSDKSWYERSPCAADYTSFCFVNSVGSPNWYDADSIRGVAFAFCF